MSGANGLHLVLLAALLSLALQVFYLMQVGWDSLRPHIPALLGHGVGGLVVLAMAWLFYRWQRELRLGKGFSELAMAGFAAFFSGILSVGLRVLIDPGRLSGPALWLFSYYPLLIWVPTGLLLYSRTLSLGAKEVQATRSHVDGLQAVLAFSEAVTLTDGDALVREIVAHSRTLAQADSVVLFLHDPASDLLRVVAHYHDPAIYSDEYIQRMVTFSCPRGHGVTGRVLESGEVVLIPDTSADRRVVRPVGSGVEPPRTSLVLPLKVHGRIRGVLRMTRTGINQFSDVQVTVASIFANQAAVALEAGELYQSVLRSARTDHLTGLLNMRALHETMRELLVRREPFSVLMIDADTLKQVNDSLGHQAGDHLLTDLARVLQHEIREVGGTAYRYAGDEFVVLLPNQDREAGLATAERIRHNRSCCMIETAHGRIRATVSIGVAAYPSDGSDISTLLTAADQAMYASKQGGRNQVRGSGLLDKATTQARLAPLK